MMNPRTATEEERRKRGGEKDEEGSTSTYNIDCDDILNDVIDYIDNEHVIAEAVVVVSPSYVTDRCFTWCVGNGLG